MSARTRLIVLIASAPLILFVMLGGLLTRVSAGDDSYSFLGTFAEVFSLVTESYVEEVDVDKVMNGAMRGLAEGAGPDSAYLTPEQVGWYEKGEVPAGDVGLELTRQYYLRVVAVADGSPAARAGIRTGDYLRAIDGKPAREMAAFVGERMLRGKPGSKVTLTVIRGNAAEPHQVEVEREVIPTPKVTARVAAPGIGYLRIPAFLPATAKEVRERVAELEKEGVTHLIVDVRSSAFGKMDHGIDVARLFVKEGTLGVREEKRTGQRTFRTAQGDGAVKLPVTLLVDSGTSGPGEVFAAALAGNKRASLIGERTQGRVTEQMLARLPDGSGMLISYAWFLSPSGDPIHEKGITPDVEVATPEVEFGSEPPPGDPILEKALEKLAGASSPAA